MINILELDAHIYPKLPNQITRVRVIRLFVSVLFG